MKKLVILSLVVLAACSSRRDVVIPYENGINEVNYENHDKRKAMIISLRWADDYCDYKGKDFVVVERKTDYKKGWLSENADKQVSKSVELAESLPVNIPIFGGVIAKAIGGKTNEKLLFRCIERK